MNYMMVHTVHKRKGARYMVDCCAYVQRARENFRIYVYINIQCNIHINTLNQNRLYKNKNNTHKKMNSVKSSKSQEQFELYLHTVKAAHTFMYV